MPWCFTDFVTCGMMLEIVHIPTCLWLKMIGPQNGRYLNMLILLWVHWCPMFEPFPNHQGHTALAPQMELRKTVEEQSETSLGRGLDLSFVPKWGPKISISRNGESGFQNHGMDLGFQVLRQNYTFGPHLFYLFSEDR